MLIKSLETGLGNILKSNRFEIFGLEMVISLGVYNISIVSEGKKMVSPVKHNLL